MMNAPTGIGGGGGGGGGGGYNQGQAGNVSRFFPLLPRLLAPFLPDSEYNE
jgi:hypothetical protein